MTHLVPGRSDEQGMLFVTGTARAGTTTMADFLRKDRRIVMGRERYGWRLRDGTGFGPDLFEKDRFCLDYRPDDSHHLRHQPYYAEAYTYFDEARWVGDKIPALFDHFDLVFSMFPGARVIDMAREPYGVADSYQRRADETRQRALRGEPVDRAWPADRGWGAAITDWNRSVRNTLQRLETEAIHVVDYDRLYRHPETLEALYRFLELTVEETTRRLWAAMGTRRTAIEAARVSAMDEAAHRTIAQRADFPAFERLRSTISY